MEYGIPIEEEFSERVKPISLPVFDHIESGVSLKLKDMTVCLLDEKDFAIEPKDFRPTDHEHAIPKFEMARIYILVCAMTGGSLGFKPQDRQNEPVYPIYEKAYQKLVRTTDDKSLFLGIARVGQEAGFLSDLQVAKP